MTAGSRKVTHVFVCQLPNIHTDGHVIKPVQYVYEVVPGTYATSDSSKLFDEQEVAVLVQNGKLRQLSRPWEIESGQHMGIDCAAEICAFRQD